MIYDGKALSRELAKELKNDGAVFGRALSLAVFCTGLNEVSQRFLGVKKRFADSIGVTVIERELSPERDRAREQIQAAAKEHDGIIVQLPLPEDFPMQAILDEIPLSHDVDVLSHAAVAAFAAGSSPILPPVVGAMAEILRRSRIDPSGKRVVVVGQGKLVGIPAAVWFSRTGSSVTIVDEETNNKKEAMVEADILILGAGKPGLVTPDMIKEGAVILDAGTSEAAGRLLGDADPACAAKASLLTPVPGGIGPVTVAMLFRNLLVLAKNRPA